MSKKNMYTVIENKMIAKNVFNLILEGDMSFEKSPGKFINILVDGFFLRRPFSMCDWNDTSIRIIYKAIGSGTHAMSMLKEGDKLDVLTGLGNGFTILDSVKRPLIVGGGVGVPPLYSVVKAFVDKGITPKVVIGFQSKEDVFLYDEFKELGCDVIVTTIDGTFGEKGTVIDAIKDLSDYDYFYSCGPMGMLKAVCENTYCEGQLSLEERMGCGFGSCLACSCKTNKGEKRICKEGPVFFKEDLSW